MTSNAFHPKVEDLNRMVLLLSNKQDADRLFIEVPNGNYDSGIPVAVSLKKYNTGWFDQAWFAEQASQSVNKTKTAYTLRNIRSGTYLQLGAKLPDGGYELAMGPKGTGPTSMGKQIWEITNDDGFARIKHSQSVHVFELSEPNDGTPPKVVLRPNDPSDKQTQTWKYERVSRSAADIITAMKNNGHIRSELDEYQSTDATYITLPPQVRDEIWKSTGLGTGSLVWRSQIFDCDDFAFAAKSAVSCWAAKTLRADGFTVLFGITFGERKGKNNKIERHAYNWYLKWQEDLTKIVFFEPSTGDESDDGWNYKGFNGIF